MSGDVLIKAEGISKKFSSKLKTSMKYGIIDIAKDFMGVPTRSDKLRKNEFWGVQDVSFEVRRGECLGLIGPNGAGKSTLLKMLNGIIMPDKGSIEINGRVGALIEVGAGFHPILTGRENIYINGSIMGLRKKEIDQKFDSIVKFAELGDFIDTPVSYYSSGMYVRLGFAVAAHLEPDVLLIDEVLSVGDQAFRTKSFNRIQDLLQKTAVIFVSHFMPHISRVCDHALLIGKGKMKKYSNNVGEVIAEYHSTIENSIGKRQVGSGKGSILNMRILNENNSDFECLKSGERFYLKLSYKVFDVSILDYLSVMIIISDSCKQNIAQLDAKLEFSDRKEGEYIAEFEINEIFLNGGKYLVQVALLYGDKGEIISALYNSLFFSVKSEKTAFAPTIIKNYKIVNLNCYENKER